MTLARSMTQEHLLQDFGNRLRHLRKARKLRQLDMAGLWPQFQVLPASGIGASQPNVAYLA